MVYCSCVKLCLFFPVHLCKTCLASVPCLIVWVVCGAVLSRGNIPPGVPPGSDSGNNLETSGIELSCFSYPCRALTMPNYPGPETHCESPGCWAASYSSWCHCRQVTAFQKHNGHFHLAALQKQTLLWFFLTDISSYLLHLRMNAEDSQHQKPCCRMSDLNWVSVTFYF